jgi:Icc-related predicted phosphoesterase
MREIMKILVLGDLHKDLPKDIKIAKKVDLILTTGDYRFVPKPLSRFQIRNLKKIVDLTNKGMTWEEALYKLVGKRKILKYRKIGRTNWEWQIRELAKYKKPVISTWGNTDIHNTEALVKEAKEFKNYRFPVNKIVKFNGYNIFVKVPWHHDFPEKPDKRIFARLKKTKNLIILTHYPPYGILDEVKGKKTGQRFYRKIIDEAKPLLFICGHIHEGQGMKKHKKTLVLNAGNVKSGRAVLIELPKLRARFLKI